MNPLSACFRLAISAVFLTLMMLPDTASAISCRVRLSPIDFGIYVPLTTNPVDVLGSVTVRCQAQPGNYAVTIGPGINGTQLLRIMSAGGGELLNYNLYRDAARTQIWGDGTPPTFTVTGTRPSRGRPTTTAHPIYGRIFANQAPNAGTYTDGLLVTVLF